MNPVDHVRISPMDHDYENAVPDQMFFYSLTVVVTTSILVRLRPCPGTPPRVKRPVLSLPGEPVCSVVPRRRRSKGDDGNGRSSFSLCDGLKILFFCYETYVPRRLRDDNLAHTSLAKSRLWPTSKKLSTIDDKQIKREIFHVLGVIGFL